MMYHEIRQDNQERGVRTVGRGPFNTETWGRIAGNVTAENHLAVATEVEGVFAVFYPEVSSPVPPRPHPYVEEVESFSDPDHDAKTVTRFIAWQSIEVDEAAQRTRAAFDARWNEAMLGGVPVQANGEVVRLAFDEHARNLYAAIPETPANRPADGMPVRLIEGDTFNGKTTLDIKGDPKFDAVEKATFGHRCAGNRAWAKGYEDVAAIVDGTGTDEEKVAALAGIDVNDPVYLWPSNDTPAP